MRPDLPPVAGRHDHTARGQVRVLPHDLRVRPQPFGQRDRERGRIVEPALQQPPVLPRVHAAHLDTRLPRARPRLGLGGHESEHREDDVRRDPFAHRTQNLEDASHEDLAAGDRAGGQHELVGPDADVFALRQVPRFQRAHLPAEERGSKAQRANVGCHRRIRAQGSLEIARLSAFGVPVQAARLQAEAAPDVASAAADALRHHREVEIVHPQAELARALDERRGPPSSAALSGRRTDVEIEGDLIESPLQRVPLDRKLELVAPLLPASLRDTEVDRVVDHGTAAEHARLEDVDEGEASRPEHRVESRQGRLDRRVSVELPQRLVVACREIPRTHPRAVVHDQHLGPLLRQPGGDQRTAGARAHHADVVCLVERWWVRRWHVRLRVSVGHGEADVGAGGRARVRHQPAEASDQRHEIVEHRIVPELLQHTLPAGEIELVERPAPRPRARIDLLEHEAEQGSDRVLHSLEIRLDVAGDLARIVQRRCARRGEMAEL